MHALADLLSTLVLCAMVLGVAGAGAIVLPWGDAELADTVGACRFAWERTSAFLGLPGWDGLRRAAHALQARPARLAVAIV